MSKRFRLLGPTRVRFVFKEPWPDFPAFYGTFVTSAGWVVPKRYVERVGEEALPESARRRRPVQVRQLQSRRGAGARGLRGLLAEDPLDQAARLPEPARRDHPRGGAQERRGGHRLPAQRRHRRRTSGAPRDCAWSPRCSASSGSTSRTSGTPSRPGPIGASDSPPASPSTVRRSIRPRRWVCRAPPAASSRATSSSPCRSSRPPYDPKRARQLLAEAGLPQRLRRRRAHAVSRPTTRWARRSRAGSRPSASAPGCAPWSAGRS